MKLTNNRYYFDYNATSPLSNSVIEWLARGDFFYANPSSIHTSGKESQKIINSVGHFLFKHFHLNGGFNLLFHSGATEGINTLLKGAISKLSKRESGVDFFYWGTDHSAVVNSCKNLNYNYRFNKIDSNKNGSCDLSKLLKQLEKCDQPAIVNFTWVNNETGIIWPLKYIEEIKKKVECFIHVDAVQSIGKVENYRQLSSLVDAYTYSGHKFGAIPGSGFSFVKEGYPYQSLIEGGDQQEGNRGGTINTMAIHSLEIALKEMNEKIDVKDAKKAKRFIEDEISKLMGSKGIIVGKDADYRNSNTINILIYGFKADQLLMDFDLAGMDVSIGSACSSGLLKASSVLQEMGYNQEDSKSSIRLSFSPYLTYKDAQEYLTKITPIIKKYV